MPIFPERTSNTAGTQLRKNLEVCRFVAVMPNEDSLLALTAFAQTPFFHTLGQEPEELFPSRASELSWDPVDELKCTCGQAAFRQIFMSEAQRQV